MSLSKILKMNTAGNLSLAVTIVAITILSLPSFFTFQLNYGWWQAWSYMEESGLHLYKDVHVIFPPFFLKLTGLISNISDTRSVSMGFGILRLVALQCAFYFFLRIFFNKLPATIGAFIVAAEQIRLTTFIPDDYHVTERLFFIVSVIFFYKLIVKTIDNSPDKYLYGVFCALSMALLFYTKQNIGLGVLFATICGYTLLVFNTHKTWLPAIIFISLNITSMVFIGTILGISMETLDLIMFSNDAKGGLFTLVSNIITVPQNKRHILIALMMSVPFLFIIYRRDIVSLMLLDLRKYSDFIPKRLLSDILTWSPSLAVCFGFILLLFFSNYFVTIALAIGMIGLIWSTKNDAPKYTFLAFPFMGMLYASSMTSALVFDSAVMFSIVVFCLLLQISLKIKKSMPISQMLIWLFFSVYSTNLLVHKINVPYSWWGLTNPPINFSTESFDVPQLKYTKMDQLTANILEIIQTSIKQYSSKNDDVYLYPHLPYLYKIFGKLPPTKNSVQWFDVVSLDSLADEIDDLERKKPNLLIFFDPPNGTYLGHAQFKKIEENPQKRILDWVDYKVSKSHYELIKYVVFNNAKTIESAAVSVRFKNLNNKTAEQISRFNDTLRYSTMEDEIINTSSSAHTYKVTKLIELESLANFFGGLFKEDEHFYALKIYRRVN